MDFIEDYKINSIKNGNIIRTYDVIFVTLLIMKRKNLHMRNYTYSASAKN